MLGLLGSAMAGGAEAVDRVSQGRIDDKRKKALEKLRMDFRTSEREAGQEHAMSMQEDSQNFTTKQAETQNSNARNNNWGTEVDKDGNLVRINPTTGDVEEMEGGEGRFGTKAPDITERQKLAVETKMSEIEAIRESISNAGGVATDEQKQRMGRLNGEINQIIGGGGGLTLEQLKNGIGGGQDQGGEAPAPEEKPSRVRGLLNQRMQGNEQEEQTSTIQQEVDGLLDQTDDMLNRLRPKAVPGNMGRPSPNAYKEPSAEDIKAGEKLVQKLIELDENPEYHSAISQRQRANIVQRIMDLKEAGVPINIDPKP